jgi:hypothetical protein
MIPHGEEPAWQIVSMKPINERLIPCFDEKFPVPSKKFPVLGEKIPCSAMLRELGYKPLKLLRKLTPIRPNRPGIGKIPC